MHVAGRRVSDRVLPDPFWQFCTISATVRAGQCYGVTCAAATTDLVTLCRARLRPAQPFQDWKSLLQGGRGQEKVRIENVVLHW